MLGRLKFDIDPLVCQMLDQIPNDIIVNGTILDPAIGGGQFVREVERRKRAAGKTDAEIAKTVFGIEQNVLRKNYAVNKHKLSGTYQVANFLEKDFKNMKFDVIVGNPPFSGSKNEIKGTRAKQLYKEFVEKSMELSDNVLMVLPSLWTHKPGTLKTKLCDFGFKKIASCTSSFNIDMQTCYIVASKGYKGNLTVAPEDSSEYVVPFDKNYPLYLNSSLVTANLIDKVKSDNNLGDIWIRSSINRNCDSIVPKKGTPLVTITGSEDEPLEIVYSTKPKSEFPGFNSWRVITNNVGHGTKIGVTKIIGPGKGTSYSVVGLVVDSKIYAKNLQSYINSKFVSFIVKSIKNNAVNSKTVFSSIPMVDLNHLWTDEELYQHFKLTEDEIDYIENATN